MTTNNQEYSIENDPLFKPISEDKKKLIDQAVEKKIRSLTLDENVDKDAERVSGQNYALISVVAPQASQKSDNICLKIKGVFATLDEANKHAEMLQKLDATFDIYVVEMYSWLLVPPDPNLIEQKHVDSKLNEIIGGHRESQLKSKMYFEERKKELMENISIENERREEENKKLLENNDNIEEVNGPEGPEGLSAESSVDITDNLNNCPNSGPDSKEQTTPSDLMEGMLNDTSQLKTNSSLTEID